MTLVLRHRPLLGAVSAEWVRLRSVRSTWAGLAAALALTLLVAPGTALALATNMDNGLVPAVEIPASEAALNAIVWAAQFAVVGVAVVFVTAEYVNGAVHFSLQAVPVRRRLLAAKAIVLSTVVAAAAVVMTVAGTLLAHALLSHPLLGDHGTLKLSDAVPDVLRAIVHLVTIALIGLGFGAALRSTATALGAVFLLILGLPAILVMTGADVLLPYFPLVGGISLMDGALIMGPPPEATGSPLSGLVVLMSWAICALTVGTLVLEHRDA
ncbi:ABC transporter permease [Nocardiopsis alba]|uniref:ABC transporter permease n=1 Tax=Nocardiopsis alba TaxID=53437 RepID=UPI0036CE783B